MRELSFNYLSEMHDDLDDAFGVLCDIRECTSKKDMIVKIRRVKGIVSEIERKIRIPGTDYIEKEMEE